MSHTIEHYAEQVAEDVSGPEPKEGQGQGAVNWQAIIDMVLKIVTQLLANCPAKQGKLLDAIKAPGRMQRARFGALVYDMSQGCDCCKHCAQQIEEGMKAVAAKMPDGEILAAIFEVQNEDWLVV